MIYLDASYIVKCYLNGAGSRKVLALVQERRGRSCALHSRVELFSAVHPRVREKHLCARDAATVWKRFESDELSGLWHWLALTENVIRRACDVFEKLPADVFLRSSHALHLACAAENRFAEVYSNDRILLEAAPHFGLDGINVC